jgi:hypothetical protein
MEGLVPEIGRLETREKLTIRGNMVMVLKMVSLSEGACKKKL